MCKTVSIHNYPHSGTTFTTNQGYVYGYYKDWLLVLGTVYSKVCFNVSTFIEAAEAGNFITHIRRELSEDGFPM
jgi:hypothetical protein